MMECQAAFQTEDGQRHAVWVIDDPDVLGELQEAFDAETLYVADGHHRYETALGYRDEVRAAAGAWTGEEPENFAMVALTTSEDPGLLVLPIHRVTNAEAPLDEVLTRLRKAFRVGTSADLAAALASLDDRVRPWSFISLAAA